MRTITNSNLGFPRIGGDREWKKAIEAFWNGKMNEEELHGRLSDIRHKHWRLQQEKGIELIPVGDFSYYDQVLDMAVMFGLVPERFEYEGGRVPLSTYYAIARGNETATASEMTKWFNTNYHYIVPELGGREPQLTFNAPLEAYREAKSELGLEGKPVLLGLYTFLKLSKGEATVNIREWSIKLLPLYVQVLCELREEGVAWVQVDEPALVTAVTGEDMELVQEIYEEIAQQVPGVSILLQTYFDAAEHYEQVISLPVQGIGLDFVHGKEGNLQGLRQYGFPADKTLGMGIIDGRNIWRTDLPEALALFSEITALVPASAGIIIQPSCSLLHVPVSAQAENGLPSVLQESLAFAEEKLDEIAALSRATKGDDVPALFAESGDALRRLADDASRSRKQVQEAVATISIQPSERSSAFASRRLKQQAKWNLPLLPTTTIGSFPQTAEVRAARQKWRRGEWSAERYDEFIAAEIKKWISIQEEIGLDVLVHGEFERTDMVEFFGEKLPGFAFTRGGWVQSYGTRCVKPPLIYGDVQFDQPMTVKETAFAQSLTSKPVKGMLTGPVTILNWSFVRSDVSRETVAYQIALALRKEVEALENAGITMIQVDEPALREGFPLKPRDSEAYLDWAVKAFKISTSTVRETTQIHTHMCYCAFHDMLDSIQELDADVISIETSRSHGELIRSFEENTYPLGIGLGVYDIHSPRVPSIEEMVAMISRALQVLDPSLFWINPDCGLKTRGQEETVAALANMASAAKRSRELLVSAGTGM